MPGRLIQTRAPFSFDKDSRGCYLPSNITAGCWNGLFELRAANWELSGEVWTLWMAQSHKHGACCYTEAEPIQTGTEAA